MINTLQSDIYETASCLPWLHPNTGNKIKGGAIGDALRSFAVVSPTSRTLHVEIVPRLVAQAQPEHLGDLVRLACVMGSKEMWARVVTLIQESPNSVSNVVVAVPWNDLPKEVRDVAADLHPAVGAARGQCDRMPRHASALFAVDFFAALDPNVWDALNLAVQRRWLQAPGRDAYLAVRSLGPCTEIMARATLTNDLVRATQRHH